MLGFIPAGISLTENSHWIPIVNFSGSPVKIGEKFHVGFYSGRGVTIHYSHFMCSPLEFILGVWTSPFFFYGTKSKANTSPGAQYVHDSPLEN